MSISPEISAYFREIGAKGAAGHFRYMSPEKRAAMIKKSIETRKKKALERRKSLPQSE